MRRARCFALIALFLTASAARPDEHRHVSLVPWRVLEHGEPAEDPLTLFWIPGSAAAMRRSPLLVSNELTRFSARCVAMRVIRLDDHVRLASLGIAEERPVALLAEGTGRVIGSVAREDLSEIEDLVRDELDLRTFHADTLLDQARTRASAGDKSGAIALYREVWEARCMCPRQGKVAGKALRRLAQK